MKEGKKERRREPKKESRKKRQSGGGVLTSQSTTVNGLIMHGLGFFPTHAAMTADAA